MNKNTEQLKVINSFNFVSLANQMEDARSALSIALSEDMKLIHPGAFLVFFDAIRRIVNQAGWINEFARNADLECFAPEKEESEKEEKSE